MDQGCLLCGHYQFLVLRIVAVTVVVLGQVGFDFLERTSLAYCTILENYDFVGVRQQAVVVSRENNRSTGFSKVTI